MIVFIMSLLDICIISAYAIIIFVVGIKHSKNVTTFRDYAISNKKFGSAVLVATLCATIIDSGAIFGVGEKIVNVGPIFLVLCMGEAIVKIITAKFIAPRTAQMRNKMSVGEVMGDYYGKSGRIFTAIAGIILCVGYIGTQYMIVGYLFQEIFGYSYTATILITSFIIAVYTVFGGIRPVVVTDVIQFAVIIVAIPILCNYSLTLLGGYSFFEKLPDTHKLLFPEGGSGLMYSSIFLIYSIPFLNPAFFQRIFLVKNNALLKKSLYIGAAIDVPFYAIITMIALSAMVLNPSIGGNSVFPYLINTYLPAGIKGIVITGLVAVMMSTADSYLNAAGILLSHDLIEVIKGKPMPDAKKLKLARYSTFVISILATGVAFMSESIIDIIFAFLNFWGPVVVVPLLAGIFGWRVTGKQFITAATLGFTSSIIWMLFLEKYIPIDSIIPGLGINAIAYFSVAKRTHNNNFSVVQKKK